MTSYCLRSIKEFATSICRMRTLATKTLAWVQRWLAEFWQQANCVWKSVFRLSIENANPLTCEGQCDRFKEPLMERLRRESGAVTCVDEAW